MRAEAETVLQAAPDRVFAVLADLGTWPAWLDVVTRAEPDGSRAWRVRLGLAFGPASVGYDVRMVRVTPPPDGRETRDRLRFERDEGDGRLDHSRVVIDVSLVATGARTTVTLMLEIDKRIPLLDLQRQLDRRTARAARRLQQLLDER